MFRSKTIIFIVLIFSLMCITSSLVNRKLSVLKHVSQQPDLNVFYSQLLMSGLARSSLNYREVTVFAPTNQAFRKFPGPLGQNLTGYHVAYNAYALKDLNHTYLESIQKGLPPLWIRKYNGVTYVNNAMIIDNRSDYNANHRMDVLGKPQMLHVLDEVLDPGDIFGETSPTVLDVMINSKSFNVKKFLSKVFQYKSEELYQNDGANTYFVPIDEGMDDYRSRMTDSYIVKAHIIPNRVLFTRPVPKNSIYDSLADLDYICILLSFQKDNVKYYIKSNTVLGDTNHRNGEIRAEILHANIPVKNGVVHIINRPLGVFDKVLSKFPYLPVLDKLAMDPYLNVSYTLGLRSGFNHILKQPNKKFTFFIPRDQAWRNLKNQYDYDRLLHLQYLDDIKKVMGRHLVVGDIPYSMETLHNASGIGCVYIQTSSGRNCVTVLRRSSDDNFVIKWNNIYIDVYKANYECSNGLVHVIDRPFVTQEDIQNAPTESVSFFQLWGAVHKLLSAT